MRRQGQLSEMAPPLQPAASSESTINEADLDKAEADREEEREKEEEDEAADAGARYTTGSTMEAIENLRQRIGAPAAENGTSNATDYNCSVGVEAWLDWPPMKKSYCCILAGHGCQAWTLLHRGQCKPPGLQLNVSTDWGSGLAEQGCKDECDQTNSCNLAIYAAKNGTCTMFFQPIAPSECETDVDRYTFWKPKEQAAGYSTTASPDMVEVEEGDAPAVGWHLSPAAISRGD